jgi:hypothetical protein
MKLTKNPLGEEIPEVWLANEANSPEGKWAANLRPAPLGRGITNTTAIGRATDVDIRTGWVGHLTTREMKDRWSRHKSVIPANHMDNHKNGTSCAPYEAIRWGALWVSRHTKGWTPLAYLGHEWLGINRKIPPYHFQDVPIFGAPQVYLSKLFRPVKHFL